LQILIRRSKKIPNEDPILLKIGGSVITDKTGELSAKTKIINRLAEEIKKANLRNLIIVHGGGSFGHPMAKKYSIKQGYKKETQKVGFAETHHVMTVLNGLFMDALIWHNIPAVSITPLSCIITNNGRIQFFNESIIKSMLKMGISPVLYGDVILDDQLGFTVVSGDQIVSYLAKKLRARKIVLGVDVDGLFDSDPKKNTDSKLFTNLTLKELINKKKNLSLSTSDVTGGMLGKINEITSAIEQGIPVSIVNANENNRMYKALIGDEVEGTSIRRE
jgi:isopentenyl phosphate kinase